MGNQRVWQALTLTTEAEYARSGESRPAALLFLWLTFFVVALTALSGCSSQRSDGVVESDMRADFDHDHKHTHSDEIAHDHRHDDFDGSHSHGHAHGHRHAPGPHGGRVVSIGHTHHEGVVGAFHAEVLPFENNRIAVYLLSETANGELEPASIEADSFKAVVGPTTDETGLLALEVLFEREDAADDTFFSALIEKTEDERLTVVVPRIELGGQRLNYSFEVSTNDAGRPSRGEPPQEDPIHEEDEQEGEA